MITGQAIVQGRSFARSPSSPRLFLVLNISLLLLLPASRLLHGRSCHGLSQQIVTNEFLNDLFSAHLHSSRPSVGCLLFAHGEGGRTGSIMLLLWLWVLLLVLWWLWRRGLGVVEDELEVDLSSMVVSSELYRSMGTQSISYLTTVIPVH